MFEGELAEGELEIGQIASMLTKEESVEEIFKDILQDYHDNLQLVNSLRL